MSSTHSQPSSPAIASSEQAELLDSHELEGDQKGKRKAQDSLRRSQACLACRKRKLRCDAKKPTCSRCEAAWRGFNSRSDSGEANDSTLPPCEYDVSLFSKIFKRPASPEPSTVASSSNIEGSKVSRNRPERSQAAQSQHSLRTDNERLRARISLLEADLQTQDGAREAGFASSSASSHEDGKPIRSTSSVLQDQGQLSTIAQIRRATGEEYSESQRWSALPIPDQSFERSEDRTVPSSTPSQLFTSTPSSNQVETGGSTPITGRLPTSSSQSLSDAKFSNIPRATDAPSLHIEAQPVPPPPLPPKNLLLEIANAFKESSWLAFAFNTYALTDLIVILDSLTTSDIERCIAETILMALIAVSLPFCPSVVAQLPELLGREKFPTGSVSDTRERTPIITGVYASGARELLRQIRVLEGTQGIYATLPARLLLVEYASVNDLSRESHAELGRAIVEARFLDLHDLATGVSPRLDFHRPGMTEIGHALGGLMQAKQQNYAFWYLYTQDCFQSTLAGSPSLIDRDSIRTVFQGRLGSRTLQVIQQAQNEVVSYLRKDPGLPQLETIDDTFCIFIKATMVLTNCCEFSTRVRRAASVRSGKLLSDLRQGRDSSFQATNEEIRLLRLILNQYNDRKRNSAMHTQDESRGDEHAILTDDLLQFAADTTHHLCVLSLFGGLVDPEKPFEQGDSRDVVKTAATWISRLAETSLRPSNLLSVSLAPGCSMAFFIAARWTIYLQIAFPTELQLELSTLTAALWIRAKSCANDHLLAKAIVALARQRDTLGRTCISPFTWPIDAVSEFVPISRPFGSRTRHEEAAGSPFSVSLQALAISVEDAAVENLVKFSAQ